jgi:2-polyprenyl-6-methoxyphenol hydroxylase-like FAD-dependent oxidoreductase
MRGVDVVLLERQPTRPTFERAFNLGPRSLELLDRRGIVERFLVEGPRVPAIGFAGLDAPLPLAGLPTDHPYVLGIPQTRTEALLEAHAVERGVTLRRGHVVTAVAQDADGVTVDVLGGAYVSTRSADPTADAAADAAHPPAYRLRARYVVGCDGGRSTVRAQAGIAFPGTPATRYALLGDVVVDPESLPFGHHVTPRGGVWVIPRPGYARVMTRELTPPADPDAPVTLDQLAAAVRYVLGREVALSRPRWLTRFGNAARLAEQYRAGRVFLAGDAAHVHPPAGAQGINVGLQDAFNLGWKLAAAVRGWAPPALLDSYHAERHAAGECVLTHTRAQAALGEPADAVVPVQHFLRLLSGTPAVRRAIAECVTGLDTRYLDEAAETARWAEALPWLGRLAPNAPIADAAPRGGGPSSIAACLRAGHAVLVVRAVGPEGPSAHEAAAVRWRDRLVVARIASDPTPETPASAWLSGVEAALVRPDGHIAWLACGDGTHQPSLHDTLVRWLGTPL